MSVYKQLLFIVITASVCSQWCTCWVQPVLEDPGFPEMGLIYSLRIEANVKMDDGDYTMDTDEYWDGEKLKGRVTTYRDDAVDHVIHDFSTNQSYAFLDSGTCETGDVIDDNGMFGNLILLTGGQPMGPSAAIMSLTKYYNTEYRGRETVRGIEVDQWTTTIATMSVVYSWSASNWTTAMCGEKSVPVRITMFRPGKPEHHYEYVQYREYIEDSTVLDTPSMVFCPNRTNTKELPESSFSFKFSEEIVLPDFAAIYHSDVSYDYEMQLVRYTYSTGDPVAPYYAIGRIAEVHDFNTGLKYVIDKRRGNCTILHIDNSTWDVDTEVPEDGSAVFRLKKPGDFLLLAEEYHYTGERTYRGIPVDVWIASIEDFSDMAPPGVEIKSIIIEYGFSNGNVSDIVEDLIEDVVPIFVESKSRIAIDLGDGNQYEMEFTMKVNVYEFYEGTLSPFDFSINECNPDLGEEMMLTISYDVLGGEPEISKNYRRSFETQTVLAIATAANISVLRIPSVQVDYDTQNVYSTATLIDRAPSLSYFSSRDGPETVPASWQKDDFSISSASDCADLCLENDCDVFGYCEYTVNLVDPPCRILRFPVVGGESFLVDFDKYCRLYEKVQLENNIVIEPTNEEVYKILESKIQSGEFIIRLPELLQDHSDVEFVAHHIVDVSPSSDLHIYGETFYQMPDKGRRNFEDSPYVLRTYKNTDITACETYCATEEMFQCKGFNLCGSNCYMVNVHPGQLDTSEGEMDTSCELYARQYTNKFMSLEKIMSDVDAELQLENVTSTEACAEMCFNMEEFDCRSFEHCTETLICKLFKVHGLDHEKWIESTTCFHYSRNYVSDFSQYPGVRVHPSDPSIIYGKTSLEECAKACVEYNDDFECRSFDYCTDNADKPKETCLLSGVNLKDKEASTDSNDGCDHYSRQVYLDGMPVLSDMYEECLVTVTEETTGFSGGAMAALAFSMMLVGAILATLILYAFKKQSDARASNSTIRFANDDAVMSES